MGNTETIQAITANLTTILTAQGFLIENSSTDKELATAPSCAIRLTGERFESTHGERPSYNEVRYSLRIAFSDAYPSTSRGKIAEWMHKIRNTVTVPGLNIGDLAVSQLVSLVSHDGYNETDYSPPVTELEYNLQVRYREL